MTKETRKLKFRRRREGKTDYAKRLALLKSGKKRVVFRRSNKRIEMQVIEYSRQGDKTLFSASSEQLKKLGFPGKCNTPSAYLTGYWLGRKALNAGISEAVFDLGMITPVHGGRAFAALKGLGDSGLKVKGSDSVFPKQERIEGKHIKGQDIAEMLEAAKKKINGTGKAPAKEAGAPKTEKVEG